MSWLSIAAGFLRDAMSSDDAGPKPQSDSPPSADIAGIVEYVNRHRAETGKNFEAVARVLREQNEQYLRALQIQKRWNIGLAIALAAVAALAVAGYMRG